LADGSKQQTWIEQKSLRPFKDEPEKPQVLFALEGLGMGWGLIDYRYRDLFVRLDAEKGCAVGDISLNAGFSPSWSFHDAAEIATGAPAGYLDTPDIGVLLRDHRDAIFETISSSEGQTSIAAIRESHYDEQAADRAALRLPDGLARLRVQIEEQRQLDRTRYRDWTLIAVLVVAVISLLVWQHLRLQS
jgi:hypothetical protein